MVVAAAVAMVVEMAVVRAEAARAAVEMKVVATTVAMVVLRRVEVAMVAVDVLCLAAALQGGALLTTRLPALEHGLGRVGVLQQRLGGR